MRILLVGRNARVGGGSTFRLNIATGLIQRGHRVWVACSPGEVLPRFRAAGVSYVWTPPAPLGGPWLLAAIRRHGIDLVHASNTTPGTAAEWACRRAGVPLVLSIHGFLGQRDHLRSCLQSARRILTFEEKAVENLRGRGVIDMERVILLRRPIPHRPNTPPQGPEFRIVAAGRLSKRKGRNTLALLKAFEDAARRRPALTLDILGGGSLLREVRREAKQVNSRLGREAVRPWGSLADPAPLMERAHLVVGASYCALEMIMRGAAVIGAGFWGFGPVHVENLRQGMAWNFGDVGGGWRMSTRNFASALEELLAAWDDPEMRPRYWGLDRLIADEHALERVAERIEGIYLSVLVDAGRAGEKGDGPQDLAGLSDNPRLEPAGGGGQE